MKRRELLAGALALVGLTTVLEARAQPAQAEPLAARPIPTNVVPVIVRDLLQSFRKDEKGKETPVNIVVLQQQDEPQFLPIWIGEAEATSILRSINGEVPVRPMAHDLMVSLVEALKGQVKSIVLFGVPQEGLYTAAIKVVGKDIEKDVDSRPSDAIALALRTEAPLYVERNLLKPLDIDEWKNRMLGTKQ